MFASGIFIDSPVAGFLPTRAARFVTENVPNPIRLTLSPLARELSILSRNYFKVDAASLFVVPASSAAFAINSSFVI